VARPKGNSYFFDFLQLSAAPIATPTAIHVGFTCCGENRSAYCCSDTLIIEPEFFKNSFPIFHFFLSKFNLRFNCNPFRFQLSQLEQMMVYLCFALGKFFKILGLFKRYYIHSN
jgi:hypothetical protein